MVKGVILHLENDKSLLEQYDSFYKQLGMELDYIGCSTSEEFNLALENNEKQIKAIIFDLIGHKATQDELSGNPEFLAVIEEKFIRYNLPIFIYSGQLESISDRYNQNGTVFKVSKDESISEIFTKIKFLSDSGFIEVFCPGGILERQIHRELHHAFTKQFLHSDEIEKIILNIKGAQGFELSRDRIKKVFKRIAVRTLHFELLLPEVNEKGQIIEETVSTSEHYIRRIGSIPVWTGDIFKKKGLDEFVFILTPRCNVIRNNEILVCPFNYKDIIKKKDKISKMLQGDPTVSGYDRHIPPSPIFEGGKLALSKYFMLKKEILVNEYSLAITLSDELTNEILGKFGSHFFRTGITPWDSTEATDEISANNV
ncbi:hypothetical protein ACPUEN_04370 [Algoriphagus yeomjeoni]|uniref:hypothetical protein n=1 Tax=Algoriphagus yeomjeoni TaxID=291403 RepID=UPI003CE483F7